MKRDQARRIISMLDLPLPGVNMQMWGIQISSRKPDDMAEVMRRVRDEIDRTQQAVRDIGQASLQTGASTRQVEKAAVNLTALAQQLQQSVERYRT